MNRDDDVRKLLDAGRLESTPEERRAIVDAAGPVLADLARNAAGASRRTGPAWLGPRRLAFAAAAAVVLGILLFAHRPPTRVPHAAPVLTWAEHVKTDGGAFPLASAQFPRPY